jgi:hypothetical protein
MHLRLFLEKHNFQIVCEGAKLNAWASSMCRDMSGGRRVYLTKMGQRAKIQELTNTFCDAGVENLATVAQQSEYHKAWLGSIMSQTNIPVQEYAVREAKLHPNGWVYVIDGDYGPDDDIPPEAIVGAWKVDSSGMILGEFIPNPKHKPA